MTTQFLTVGDKTLAYVVSGEGPPVVVVHGVGGHKEDWAGVAAALSGSHRVYAIDMLGFGESSKNGDDLSMDVQADAIAALLDDQGVDRAAIIGNSVGAWVSATFAVRHAARVERLVLSDAAGFKAMFEGEPPANFDPNNVEEMQKLIDMTINGPVAHTPGLAEKAFTAYVSSGEKAITQIWGASLFRSTRLEELLPRITAPTLVLWGAEDKLFPSALCPVFTGMIPGAQSVLIPDAGHFPQIDNPDATIAAIAGFLDA